MENLARYVVRASFSQERMTYVPDESKVVYRSKDRKSEKIFDPLEGMAAMCSRVPNKGEQMVRYYGYYSNVSRGSRKRQNQDEWTPCILEPDKDSKEYRRNWARLIQKIHEVDPLTCPKCSGPGVFSIRVFAGAVHSSGRDYLLLLVDRTTKTMTAHAARNDKPPIMAMP